MGAPTKYAALGDSYSSGEGLFDTFDGKTNTPTDRCHRSSQAYSQRANPKGSLFVACSVMTTDAFWNTHQSEPAESLSLGDDDKLVSMTLGGNNLNWTDTLLACTNIEDQVVHTLIYSDDAKCKRSLDGGGGQTTMVQRIAAMKARLKDVYDFTLLKAPNAQVRVLTYPSLFPAVRSSGGCRIARLTVPTNVTPFGVQFVIAADVLKKFAQYEQQANQAIKEAVAEEAVKYPGRNRIVVVESQFGSPRSKNVRQLTVGPA